MCRLARCGLVAEGCGETDAQVLYRLLSDLYILDFCCEEEPLDTLYYDEFTTSDNIADMISCLLECRPVMLSAANLYLRKQIIFERI